MARLSSFLPPHLVRCLRGGKRHSEPPFEERFEAALLMSDISGFTALTEKLQARGREGAEEIAGVVSAAFAPAIRAIERFDGSIQSFGGDALFALFPGASAVRRAQSAAEAIRDGFARRPEVETSAGPARLGISQAIHFGEVAGMHLGTARRAHYLVSGASVEALARLEGRATAGRVLLSEAARRQRREEPAARASRRRAPSFADSTEVESYLPERLPGLVERFEGEYRKAAVLFLETPRVRASHDHTLQAFQDLYAAILRVLATYDGLLLKSDLSSQGIKWLCAFGVPAAHEDDVERAARAALELLQALPDGVTMRGGLHAGTVVNVVIGTATRQSFDVMGDVVNTAARALAKAPWGEVWVTEAARRALQSVETSSVGTFSVKGKAEPLPLHALRRAVSAVRQVRRTAPMVGREGEMAALSEALASARAGQGSVIGIRGEVGLGKSRLLFEVTQAARDLGFAVLEGQAVSFGGTPYGPIAELLRRAIGLPEGASRADVLGRLEEEARRWRFSATDRHHLADVMGIRYEPSPLRHLDGRTIRLNNALAVRAYVRARARQEPLFLAIEDMHWSDELSREAVEALAREMADAHAILIMTFRPGYEPPPGTTLLSLRELSTDVMAQLLASLLSLQTRPPEELLALLNQRAEGNPFYAEELVRHLLETGILAPDRAGGHYRLVRDPGREELPDSVESVIAARLDRLPPDARRVLQLAAVIGRSFYFRLLTLFPDVRAHAAQAVAELETRDLVLAKVAPQDGGAEREYVFRYALTRDVAYNTILKQRRRELHLQVADVLEAEFPREREEHPAVLGHHLEEAGQPERARPYLLRGADQARRRYAPEEAERLYRSYFALQTSPTTESVAARSDFAEKVLSPRGKMAEAFAEERRALAEAADLGDATGRLVATIALGTLSLSTGKMDDARSHYEQALALALESGDRQREAVALTNLASVDQAQGHMDRVLELQEQALVACREAGDRDREGVILGNVANLYAGQGRMEEARSLYEQAIAINRDTGNRQAEGAFLGNLGTLLQAKGDAAGARAAFERALAILTEIGDRRFAGCLRATLATLHHEEGRVDLARGLYEEALAALREVEDRRMEGFVLSSMAEFQRQTQGDLAESERLLHAAEALLRTVGDKFLLGVCQCQLGHLALAGGQAERALGRAREILGAIGGGSESPLGQAVAKLERSIGAVRAGRELWRGELPEDLPAGLRRSLQGSP